MPPRRFKSLRKPETELGAVVREAESFCQNDVLHRAQVAWSDILSLVAREDLARRGRDYLLAIESDRTPHDLGIGVSRTENAIGQVSCGQHEV